MHKEVIFAIIFGSLLGLVVAFGVWRANGALADQSRNVKEAIKKENTETIAETGPSDVSLKIAQPNDKSVALSNPLTVSGLTHEENAVIVSTDDTDYFVFADIKGEFSQEVDLTGGLNEIQLISFKADGSSKSAIVLTGYSSDFSTTDIDLDNATTEGQIKEKIDQKLAERARSPQMYLGTITDITETGLQLKDDEGTIKQVSLKKDVTTYANIMKQTKKIAFSDLAIGDFVITLGYTNGKAILDAKRILVANPYKPTDKTAITGTIENKNTKELTLQTLEKTISVPLTGKNFSVSIIKEQEAMKSSVSALAKGDRVIVVGTPNGDSFTPRKIYISQKSS